MDLHISVIEDFRINNPDIQLTEWCMSGHAWVLKKQQVYPEHINPNTWMSLNEENIRAFQNEYDSFLQQFDIFIVAHVTAFALIYEKYNKPILMINSCRYDLPFCWNKNYHMVEKLSACLQRLDKQKRLIATSNNRGDQLYTLRGCGVSTQLVPSLCLYTNIRYNPKRPQFLQFHGPTLNHTNILSKETLGSYDYSLIGSFRGIIHFPYEISTMSMFEHYYAGLPIFFPSPSYLKANSHMQTISAYWGDTLPECFGNLKYLNTWIDLADFYHTFHNPNIHFFDSIHHLYQLLDTFQYVPYDITQEHTQVREKWKSIVERCRDAVYKTKSPCHLSYNRLPLLADVVIDMNYQGSGVTPLHSYPYRPLQPKDRVFVKTDLLEWFLQQPLQVPIVLLTGVSDISPSKKQCETILANQNIIKWIGCNIPIHHTKITKLLIGVGERERENGNHDTLIKLHNIRIPWDLKKNEVCIPYHSSTHSMRKDIQMLPKLSYEEYMRTLNEYKFVVCMRGNGIDTHRFCEILLMGCVPIVRHSDLDDLYSQFPCIFVDNYDTIDTSLFVWDPLKYSVFLDMFWLRKDIIKETMLNDGQIKLESGLGNIISMYARNPKYNNYVEIGTWNGRGSTYCFQDGFMKRNDNIYTLQSYESMKQRVEEAIHIWKDKPHIQIIHGRILKDNEFPTLQDVQTIHPGMSIKWHTEDEKNFWSCSYVPMNSPEVVLLDGAEYLTYFEFQQLQNIDSIQVIILDDTNVDKCSKIVSLYKTNETNGNVCSMFQMNEMVGLYLRKYNKSLLTSNQRLLYNVP